LDATRALRQLRLEPQPVVVAITANVFSEDREQCLQAKIDYFPNKPLSIGALKKAFHKVLAGEINSRKRGVRTAAWSKTSRQAWLDPSILIAE